MPSDLSYWLISSPLKNGDENALFRGIKTTVGDGVGVGNLELPELKAGTLSSLLTLSDNLPKHDAYFTGIVSKLLDTVRSLVESNISQSSSSPKSSAEETRRKLEQYLRVNEHSAEEYLLPRPGAAAQNSGHAGWHWDTSRWGKGGKVGELVENLNKEMTSIDSIQKQKQQSYNIAKGTLVSLQRKKMGNLSSKSLIDVVKKEDVVQDSDYMETLFVAVPNNAQKEWLEKYERLTSMVVPRSSSKIASDDEYTLYSVTIFKKVKDEFIHKCRENKFLAREFNFDDSALEQQNTDLDHAAAEEKELWTDLLRLSRTNFSEAYQVLVHFKVVRLFVESVLRYGLPAEYSALIIRPDPKTSLKTLKAISAYFDFLNPAERAKNPKKGSSGNDEVAGEWGAVMDQEYFDFVLFEVPKVIL